MAALALLLAGCAAPASARELVHQVAGLAPAAITAPAAGSTGATQQAIQQVIQKADQEQAQALAANNPDLMRDTSTDAHFQDMAQTNSGLANSGVQSIQLIGIDWGPITVNGSTAQAVANETWRTTYADGTIDQGTDENDYTLVLDNGAWKIDSDEQPGPELIVPGSPATVLPLPGQPAPAPATPAEGQSRNWSGYAASGGRYTSVSGTWTVPQVSSGSFGSDAAWVGIGGVQSHDLIQAGTQATTSGSGHVQYSAWVETLPQASQNVPLTVNPGDSVTVSLTEQSAGQWLISMKDNTTGQTYSTTRQYSSSESSAEWVEEAPSGGRQIIPLDNFGQVQFSAGSATKDGKQVSIGGAGARPITMINAAGQALASPSGLGPDGGSFTVQRTSVSSSPAVSPGVRVQIPIGRARGRGGFGIAPFSF
jgi:hypothetical protein